jgi:YidC/Oxa1 family membrane protein insertase
MDRKGIIAVSAAILVMLLWQIEFANKFAPPPARPGAAGSPSPSASAAPGEMAAQAATAPVLAAGAAPATMADTAAPGNVPEKLTMARGFGARYHFTNLGGGIAGAELTGYPAESGSDVYLNQFGSLPIGALSDLPAQGGDAPYTVTLQGSNTVVCVRNQPDGLTITKRFNLPTSLAEAHGYLIRLNISFANTGTKAIQSPGYYLYVGSAAPIHQRDLPTYTAMDWNAEGKTGHVDVLWFNAGKIFGVETHPARPVYTADADKMVWAAVSGQYFTTIVAPAGAAGAGAWARQFPVPVEGPNVLGLEGAIHMPGFTVAPGQTSPAQSFDIYAGPKLFSVLKGLGEGQEQIITYYFSYLGMAFFKPVAVVLLNGLNLLHSWTHSYAIAIILLTLCIRIVLWPVQNKATSSMRQMQELQPRMNELKEKYKDDAARMNAEVMKMYKEYNVNPLAGCLPMVIQIPIFFGFYRVLGTAVELRNSTFLWVKDLSQPDTVLHIAGFPINVLPICMAATMILQMELQPKTGDQAQQRMFKFVPLIFVFVCYNFASALALYWTIQNIFSITQLYVTRKRTAPAPMKLPAKRRTR